MEIKDKIVKLAGGGASPAIASYIQVPEPNITAPYSTSGMGQQEQQQELLDDKQKALLYEKGLPSDVEQFLQTVNGFGTSILGGSFNPRQTSRQMSQVNMMLNRIAFNKQEYDRVIKEVSSNGGLNEFAISSSGRLVVQDEEGQIKQVTPEEYKENIENYVPLTNSDLASYRSLNGAMAFNNSILNTISNGIGMEKINKMLWETINNIGKTTIQGEKFVSKQGKRVSQGLEELLSEDNADGVYKVVSKTTGQSDKARYALEYLYKTLPENAKTLLKARAVASGMDAKTGAYKLITTLIRSGLDDEVSTSISFDKAATNGANTDSEGNKKTSKVGPMTMYQTGKGGQRTVITLNPGMQYKLEMDGISYGQPMDQNGKLIPAGSLTSLIDGGIGAIAMTDDIYVGNQKMSRVNLDKVYQTASNLTRTYLPYTIDQNGNVRPFFELFKRISDIKKTIRENPQLTAAMQEQLFEDAGLSDYIIQHESGKLVFNPEKMMPFLLTNVFVSDADDIINPKAEDAMDWMTHTDLIPEVSEEILRDKMATALGGYDPDDIYATLAYIPLRDDTSLAMAVDGNLLMNQTYADVDYLQGMKNKQEIESHYVNSSSDKLGIQ